MRRPLLLAFHADDGRSSSQSVAESDAEDRDRWVSGVWLALRGAERPTTAPAA